MKRLLVNLASIAAVLLVGLLVLHVGGVTWDDIRHLGTPRNHIEDNGVDKKIPIPPDSDGRLLPAVDVTTDGAYAFMFDTNFGPVRFDPCQPIEYVINPTGQPSGGDEMIYAAIDEVSAATGLEFDYVGTTDEVASFDRDLIQEDRYGDRFAPLIFGWSTGEDTPELDGTVAGIGGSTSVTGAYGQDRYLVGGVVILDATAIKSMLTLAQERLVAKAVIMHEVGHVVGLAHVDDDHELMNPSNSSRTEWGPGDLAGLAIAGQGKCQDA